MMGVSDDKVELLSDAQVSDRISGLKSATDAANAAYAQLRLGKDAAAEYEKAKAKSDEADRVLESVKQKSLDADAEISAQRDALAAEHAVKIAEIADKMASTLIECDRLRADAKTSAEKIIFDAQSIAADLISKQQSALGELNDELATVKDDKKSMKSDVDAARKSKIEADLLISSNEALKLSLSAAVATIKEAVAGL